MAPSSGHPSSTDFLKHAGHEKHRIQCACARGARSPLDVNHHPAQLQAGQVESDLRSTGTQTEKSTRPPRNLQRLTSADVEFLRPNSDTLSDWHLLPDTADRSLKISMKQGLHWQFGMVARNHCRIRAYKRPRHRMSSSAGTPLQEQSLHRSIRLLCINLSGIFST